MMTMLLALRQRLDLVRTPQSYRLRIFDYRGRRVQRSDLHNSYIAIQRNVIVCSLYHCVQQS